jgi:hypothetical protein
MGSTSVIRAMGDHEKNYGAYVMKLLFRRKYEDYEVFLKRNKKEKKFWTEKDIFDE